MADYKITADIIGEKELTDAINGVNEVAQRAITDALNKTAYQVESRARSKAPHKTGALWGSIHTNSEPGNTARVEGDNIVARVGTNLEYARAQEYGTQGMTIHGKSKLGKSFNYIGTIKPKFYMKQAKEDVAPDFSENMRAALAIIVTHLAQ